MTTHFHGRAQGKLALSNTAIVNVNWYNVYKGEFDNINKIMYAFNFDSGNECLGFFLNNSTSKI